MATLRQSVKSDALIRIMSSLVDGDGVQAAFLYGPSLS